MNSLLKKISLTFIIFTTILALTVVYFSFSKAIISIVPNFKKVETNFTILAKETFESQNPNIISSTFSETFEEEQDTFPAQETNSEIKTQATGKVTIFNLTSENRRLVVTTRLLSPDNILYRLKERAFIPANGKTEAEVYADQPGKENEISKGVYFIIPGLQKQTQDKIYAQSFEPMTGGIKKNKIITEKYIESATNKLKEKVLEKIQKGIDESSEYEKNNSIPSLFVSEIVEIIKDTEIKEQKDEFNLGIKLKITGINFDKEKLLAIAKSKLLEKISSNQELISPLQNFTYSIEKYNSQTKEAIIKVHLEGMATLNSKTEILNKNKLVGLKKKELEEYFSQFNEIQKAEIKFSPFWTTRTPKIKDHVEIIILLN
ncbi:hypothetical protein HY750_03385 [Candidatus Kuenenbacteria bacterium]|nr:hypothetical protein [Candidatus Kuenenbacteria bacterium]